ncbi:hypothetical protein APED_15190 [Acanthopleuribacter pedis]
MRIDGYSPLSGVNLYSSATQNNPPDTETVDVSPEQVDSVTFSSESLFLSSQQTSTSGDVGGNPDPGPLTDKPDGDP